MDNRYFDSIELQEMKEQISILKGKLDKETIVNDALIRKVLSDKADKLRIIGMSGAITSFLTIPLVVWSNTYLGMSVEFTIVSAIFLTIAFLYFYSSHREMNRTNLVCDDLIEVRERVARLKQHYSSWIKFSIPFLAAWSPWLFYELYNAGLPLPNLYAAVIGTAVGGVIGGTIGTMRYRKIQRLSKELLEEIEKYRN